MPESLHPKPARAPSALFVVLVAFAIYNANFRVIHTGDSVPARLMPFALLRDHTLYLDGWVKPYLNPNGAAVYYLAESRGHQMSSYPILLPLLITPLYVAPAWWLARHKPPIPMEGLGGFVIINTMEKLSAALVAALSVGILYLALLRVVSVRASLILAALDAFGSTTWVISSQSLWRHGLSELALAGALWALVRPAASRDYGFWVGLALAVAASNNVIYAIPALIFLVYFARSQRRHLWGYCLPLVVLGIATIVYNWHFFHHLLGPYPSALPASQVRRFGRGPEVHLPWWGGAVGLLASPNRGLLIFIPWTLFSIWGAARAWKRNTLGWEAYLVPSALGIYLLHTEYGEWWGGVCFGPRYLTDVLPFLVFFLVAVWSDLNTRKLLRGIFVLAAVVSVWVEVVGAFYYPNGQWDWQPVPIVNDPRRIWDWRDTQIGRSWNAGPMPPLLLYDWLTIIRSGELSCELPAPAHPPKASLRRQLGQDENAPVASVEPTDSQQFFQVCGIQLGVQQNALQNLRVQCFRCVIRNRNPSPCGILVNLVAAALPGQRESNSLQDSDNLAGCEARQSWHQRAISTVERLTDTGWGISSPAARRSSTCNRMASLMFATASS
jgi:hypothetical protein